RPVRGAEKDCGGFDGTGTARENHRAHERDRIVRTEQHHSRAAGFDAMVLHDETAGGTSNCRRGAWGDSDRSGEPTPGVSELDAQYPRLDALAATVVGAPHSRMVLQGEQAHHSRTGNSGEVRDLQVGESRAGSRRFGYVVQLGALAVLDFGLAGKH